MPRCGRRVGGSCGLVVERAVNPGLFKTVPPLRRAYYGSCTGPKVIQRQDPWIGTGTNLTHRLDLVEVSARQEVG